MHSEAVAWTSEGAVRLLDQTQLPKETVYLDIDTIDVMVEAIRSLRVRGAPLIGVAAAMGLAAAAARAEREGKFGDDRREFGKWLDGAAASLATARPTAVNLQWAMKRVVSNATARAETPGEVVMALRHEAQSLWDEDARMCDAIGDAGADAIPPDARVLTICNTGMLATGGIGTAFGVIRRAYERGRIKEVFACETRPLRQGSRLTAWELARCGIPGTVIVDSAAATVMDQGRIDVVIAGADRIATNGDSANKIGTHQLAILARAYGIPFYIAAPRSTIDPDARSGDAIPIEERPASEIGIAEGVAGYNPAFDVTPANLITGIITDAGLVKSPFDATLTALSKPRASGM